MTTGEVYRYFLASKIDGDPLAALEKQHIAPTLTANTARAKVDGIGNNISFTVYGTVYSFTTSAFFYDAEGIAAVRFARAPWWLNISTLISVINSCAVSLSHSTAMNFSGSF